jgi:hypothetical protein
METSVETTPSTRKISRAWYGASIDEFLETHSDIVIGQLIRNGNFALLPTQRDAWLVQISLLKASLIGLSGSLFLEFNIPRMGRRIDAVLLIGPLVFVIEFKTGDTLFERAALDQVWDYALDLKNFHKDSHSVPIIPILVATEATSPQVLDLHSDDDQVFRPISIPSNRLRGLIDLSQKAVSGDDIDGKSWPYAPYCPTPTIVEAARALYANHSVEAIARHDAGAKNLQDTSRFIEQLVDRAREHRRKVICFVTGVPGAGKTLVGLNIATRRREIDQPTHAVFLSGNGPLVAVLREALTRDEMDRRRGQGEKVRKGRVAESVKVFIQNVHHFRDEALIDDGPPIDHVVIFDEAQRAWNLKQTESFMRRKKNQIGFSHSEPEFLISYMDRHKDWAVIVCLVGGGQEINRGEAGIGTWLEAVKSKFSHWDMYISPRLSDSEYAVDTDLETLHHLDNICFDDCLHLAVSMRSFRAENVSSFVKSLLDCDQNLARDAFGKLSPRYPIAITRDLGLGKRWIRDRARGTERFGLVASSKAQRLKPHAIDIRVSVDPVHWFLNGKDDTRSSYYLEDAATEFQVQGLELDWACVTWDGDLRFAGDCWSFHDFRGDRWCNIAVPENRSFLRNAYRVLLTRARQGMVIFVPPGDPEDLTRLPEFYDETFMYLAGLGIPVLD